MRPGSRSRANERIGAGERRSRVGTGVRAVVIVTRPPVAPPAAVLSEQRAEQNADPDHVDQERDRERELLTAHT